MAASNSRGKHRTDPPPLSAREVRFCRRWVEHGNGVRAFTEAGLTARSRHAAEVAAFTLLRKPEIRAFIRELQTAAADAAMVAVELLAQGFARAAFADRRKLFGPDGEMLPPHLWPDDVAATVEGIEVEELHDWETDPETGKRRKVKVGQKWKVKTERRTEARKVLAQWLGMIGGDKGEGAAGAAESPVRVYLPDNGRGDGPPPGPPPDSESWPRE